MLHDVSICNAQIPVPTLAADVRILHKRLLAMHFIACIHAVAGILEYTLPVSDSSCGVAHPALIATTLLYDVSLGHTIAGVVGS